jgi:hypothetical protein
MELRFYRIFTGELHGIVEIAEYVGRKTGLLCGQYEVWSWTLNNDFPAKQNSKGIYVSIRRDVRRWVKENNHLIDKQRGEKTVCSVPRARDQGTLVSKRW